MTRLILAAVLLLWTSAASRAANDVEALKADGVTQGR